MHDKTLNRRFEDLEEGITRVGETALQRITEVDNAKPDKQVFGGADYRGTAVNDIRGAANVLTGKTDLEYTRSEPFTGFHEKKTVPLDSPDKGIGIFRDGSGPHFKAVPDADNETVEYTPDGKLRVVPARRGRPPTAIIGSAADAVLDTGRIPFDNGGLLSTGYDTANGTERIPYYPEGLSVTELRHENHGRLAPEFAVNDTVAFMSVDPSVTNAREPVTRSVSAGGGSRA
jgi:hypothetical protein